MPEIKILTDRPFLLRYLTLWNEEIFRRNGFEFEFCSCAPFLGEGPSPVGHRLAKDFESFEKVREVFEAYDPERVFVFAYFIQYTAKNHGLFRLLSELKLPYAIMTTGDGDIPGYFLEPPQTDSGYGRFRLILAKCKGFAYRNLKAAKGFIRDFISEDRRDRIGFRIQKALNGGRWSLLSPPEFWVGYMPGSIKLQFPDYFPAKKDTRIVWTHHPLFEDHLNVEKSDSPSNIEERQAVFLGQGFGNDIVQFGDSYHIDREGYFEGVRKLLHYSRDELGLEPVKAAHPETEPKKIQRFLPGIDIIKGRSYELVRKAKYVATNNSTSAYYAVLLRKPILYVTCNDFKKPHHYMHTLEWRIETVADALGQPMVNLDETDPADIDWDAVMNIDEKKYKAFEEFYVKHPESESLPAWDIVLPEVKAIMNRAESA